MADDTHLTEPRRLVPRGASYALDQNAIFVMTELPGGALLREKVIHSALMRPKVVRCLNHEASLDVAELEPRTRGVSTYLLQGYFIPEPAFRSFAKAIAKVLSENKVVTLNVSIRHSSADRVTALPGPGSRCFPLSFKPNSELRPASRSV